MAMERIRIKPENTKFSFWKTEVPDFETLALVWQDTRKYTAREVWGSRETDAVQPELQVKKPTP